MIFDVNLKNQIDVFINSYIKKMHVGLVGKKYKSKTLKIHRN